MTSAGLRVAALAASLLLLACGAGDRPNVVLVVLDTTRADHLSLYDYPEETTPQLVSLARESIVFRRAYATSCWTLASHASLFTGLLPVTHRATQENLYLDDELETLAELLAARGYRTASFSNNSWISRPTNLIQGFEDVFPMWQDRTREGETPHPTNLAVRAWLTSLEPGQRFFVFINFIEPHWPYDPPRRYQDRFVAKQVPDAQRQRSSFSAIRWYAHRWRPGARLLRLRSQLYDADLASVDAAVGELVEVLRGLGHLEDTLLVVTADHGESLGEHGHQGHSFNLYDPVLHVPLLIRAPRARGGGRVRTDPVQLPDVFATIAAAVGAVPRDPRVVGRDLLSGTLPESRPLIAEYYYPEMFLLRFPKGEAVKRRLAPFMRRIRSIQVGENKLIRGSDGRDELYDTRLDPGETDDRLRREPETARSLAAALEVTVERLEREPVTRRSPGQEFDPETEESLRALGYLP